MKLLKDPQGTTTNPLACPMDVNDTNFFLKGHVFLPPPPV